VYLHKIIVHKPISFEDALDIARPFFSKQLKQVHFTETKHQFVFTNIKSKHFLTRTFDKRSNPNGTVTIYLGELKQTQFKKQHNMRGDGLMSYIYSGNWVNDYSTTAKKVLQEYGNKAIQSLMIYRTPIQNAIDKTLNVLSIGKWNKLKAKYGYDKFFHLALVANVGSKNIIIEKNEIINISTEYKTTHETDVMKVDMKNKDLTINEMLENTRQILKNRRYFSYDAFDNNCQIFIQSIFQENGLYSTAINAFLFQDVSGLKKELGVLPKVANAITSVASVVSDAVN
jgi:hypothetical protein